MINYLFVRVVADVWEKDVWDFHAESGSSGPCHLFLDFLDGVGDAAAVIFATAVISIKLHQPP